MISQIYPTELQVNKANPSDTEAPFFTTTPIICYKYNQPIRSTIFNFNKIVNDLDIDSNTPAS